MVMISDPAAIKALYTERAHGLPPGRNIFLDADPRRRARCCCSKAPTTSPTAS